VWLDSHTADLARRQERHFQRRAVSWINLDFADG
jgi:hypothetical protein